MEKGAVSDLKREVGKLEAVVRKEVDREGGRCLTRAHRIILLTIYLKYLYYT